MILCPSCGGENADGMRFCVKCGGTIADSSPAPGSWQQPSGNLYDTPTGGGSATGTGGGFSIGQGIMKLKVVDAMGNIPQMGTLVIRLLVQIALGFIPVIGIFLGIANALWPLWDEKKQTLHDKAAGTFVLKTGA